MVRIYTASKESGIIFEEVHSLKEGFEVINQYEEDDLLSGLYEPDFYDLVTEDHKSILS